MSREIDTAAEGMASVNDRVLFACLDDTPLPQRWQWFNQVSALSGARSRPWPLMCGFRLRVRTR
jgi:hypothetical protein